MKKIKKVTVFLGGTCNGSKWRDRLIEKLDLNKVDFYNPLVVEWTPQAQFLEKAHRHFDDICLYVLTPALTGKQQFLCGWQ